MWRWNRIVLQGWKRFIPETLALTAVLLAVDAFGGAGDRFAGMRLNPFGFLVLLIAMQYGVAGGLFACLAATLALYVGAVPVRPDGLDYYTYAATLAAEPAVWFAAACVIGGLRTFHLYRQNKLTDVLNETEQRAEFVGAEMDRALAEIGGLERQIVSDNWTVEALLRSLARADSSDRRTFAGSLGGIVRDAIGASAYAIFARTPEGLVPVLSEDDDVEIARRRAVIAVNSPTYNALAATKTLTRQDLNRREKLPRGALVMAPILGARTGALHGAILIERLCAPDRTIDVVARSTQELGYAIGAMMDRLPAPETNPRLASGGQLVG